MWVKFINSAAATVTFNVRWNANGGVSNSSTTDALLAGQNGSIDLSNAGIPDGSSCWAFANASAGESHESGQNFTYHANAPTATYNCTGGVQNLSLSLS